MMFFLLFACVQDLSRPYLGDCAQHPEGNYDYGQIGIGTCLAGPSDILFVQEGDVTKLLISNANPYLNFETGSLLVVDWDSIDEMESTIYSHELSSQALIINNFSGELESNGEWVTLSNRYSEDARDLEQKDHLLQFSFSENTLIQEDDIVVGADPIGTAYDKSSGYLFVVNQSSKDISLVDTTLDEMSVIPPWPEQVLKTIAYEGSGHIALSRLVPLSEDILGEVEEIPPLTDDLFSLTWVESSSTLWVPQDDAWLRVEYFGTETYQESALGVELRPQDNLIVERIDDPVFFGNAMLFSDAQTIYSALRGEEGSWEYDPLPLTELNVEQLAGFAYGQEQNDSFLIYAAQSEKGWSIFQKDLNQTTNFEDSELLFTQSIPVRDPALVYDEQAALWHLTYSKDDEQLGWQIWRAYSTDRQNWVFENEPMFPNAIAPHASAIISSSTAGMHMWYARQHQEGWKYIHAFSEDGIHFEEQDTLPNVLLESPQKAALAHTPNLALRLQSESVGNIVALPPTMSYLTTEYGWVASAIVGATASEKLFDEASAGGIQIDSIFENQAFLTIRNGAGTRQIAQAEILNDQQLVAGEIILSSENERYSPVIWMDEETHHLVFTERSGDQSTLLYTTSSDGISWSSPQEVLNPTGQDIEANLYDNGTLWISLEDSNGWDIYTIDVGVWSPPTIPEFERGDIGTWDDNGLRDAYIEGEEGSRVLYYSGFDGLTWQIGVAEESDGRWIRHGIEGTPAPILDTSGLFYSQEVRRFLRIPNTSSFYFSGVHDDIARVGMATEFTYGHVRTHYNIPQTGDVLSFETQQGTDEELSIPLDVSINGISFTGNGLAQLSIDSERGFLFVSSRLLPYIIVIDIRDDSNETFVDRNYLKLETTLTFVSTSGATGFRQTLAHDGILYALNDAPEGVFAIDLNTIEDNAIHELSQVPPLDILPAPRALEADEGVQTRSSIGPSRMAIRSDGRLMAVCNFNTNSISFYDLTLGRVGTAIYELPLYAENPHALTFSPDGNSLIVATYTGEIDGLSSHTLLYIIDTDPSSPTYLRTRTRIKNR